MSATLIVEGSDEEALINKLCEQHKLTKIKVVNAQGIGSIDKAFKAAIVGSGVTHIAILCDAEENPQSCKAALEQYRSQIAQSPSPNISYEYLILPNESSAGSLETLCLQLITSDDALLNCSNQFIACIESAAPQAHKLSTKARQDKARFLIRHYAATGAPKGFKSLLENNQILIDSPIFNPIVALLQRLSNKQTQ